jgi:rubredoxin
MTFVEERCIYCGSVFDATKGEGDHILPAALGEFKDDVRFRRICPRCNSRIGAYEQQVMQCGPENLFRSIVFPTSNRLKRRGQGRTKGAMGAPAPEVTVQLSHGKSLAARSLANPRESIALDNLFVRDADGVEKAIRLFPGLRADQLRQRIDELNLKEVKELRLDSCDANCAEFLALISKAWPTMTIQQQSSMNAGIHQVPTRITFTVNIHYFQAIAKIGFHYYLAHSKRNYRGDEPEFAGIRAFILNGGEKDDIFHPSGRTFATPFGEVRPGMAITCSSWCHLLAADETIDVVVVYVSLFVGPERIGNPHYITLGRIGARIVSPDFVWGHVYLYEKISGKGRFSGRVMPTMMTRLG